MRWRTRQPYPFVMCLLLWSVAHLAMAQAPRVLAPSSLTDVLGDAIRDFAPDGDAEPPVLAVAGTSRLARQLQQGAQADVVITADDAWMDELAESGHIDLATRETLAHNELVLVTPSASPLLFRQLDDLTQAAYRRIAVAGEAVPAGRRAREALQAHQLLAPLEERLVNTSSARAALALVRRAEVDAGLVYATDARIAPGVTVQHRFAATDHAPIRYQLALTPNGAARPQAAALHAYLLGPQTRALLADAGFRPVAASTGAPKPADAPPTSPHRYHPVALSIWVAALALTVSLVPGIALGWLLARRQFYGRSLLLIATMVPLVLPPVVTGYLLLQLFGRHGLFGPLLSWLGWEIAFGRWGAVVAAAVVGFPLLVAVVRQAFESVDPRYEQIAATLGRHPVSVFFSITLPMAAPGIVAGAVLAFARGLGEFGATAILAGDIPGETRTIALALFALYEQPDHDALASELVWVSVGLSAMALLGYERLSWLQRRQMERR